MFTKGVITYLNAYKLLKMCIFRKKNIISTRVHKNGQNLACDQCVFIKLAPLDSAHNRPINPCQNLKFYKISQVVPFFIPGHII